MNPFAQPVGCNTCADTRQVSNQYNATVPCPICGCTCPKPVKNEPTPPPCNGCQKSRDLKHAAFLRHHEPTTITSELDLSDEELAVFKRMRAEHPGASKTTVFMWIEGQRYDPSKDPVFMAECNKELQKWRDERDSYYEQYRRSHPYSRGDGRIGRERDRSGKLFEEAKKP